MECPLDMVERGLKPGRNQVARRGTMPGVDDTAPCRDDVPFLDVALVERLVASNPEWAGLPVVEAAPQGWDNRTFRLGRDLSARLPSGPGYAAQVGKEHRWLPVLAPLLPLPVPRPVVQCAPWAGYPFVWSVYAWIEGAAATTARPADLLGIARALAGFLAALQRCPTDGAPPAGEHSAWRGGPVSTYDDETRRCIATLEHVVDGPAATRVWEAALSSAWDRPPVWFHGDVAAGNLLLRDGRLAAVIDFGCCGVGDPACDLTVAWTMLSGESREAFRAGLPLDAATWARARGWALWKALLTVVESSCTDPATASAALRVIGEVLAEGS